MFKDGDRQDPSNYRPIAILPAWSKILECIVHKQVYKYFTDHSTLVNEQFGFRKGHSTWTCILSLTNSLFLNMNSNMLTGVVFLDLKKTFDTVHHGILFKKLQMHGMGASAIEWFANYLSNRTQCASQ